MKTLHQAKKELEKIKEHLEAPVIGYDPEDGVHQKILNVGYHHWQETLCNSYSEMLDYMEENFGPLAKMAVLIGKYNQQVCNGGHIQYHYNDYSNSGDDEDFDIHRELTSLIEVYAPKTAVNKKLLLILKDFDLEYEEENCWECDGSGEILFESEDEDGEDEYETCRDCDGRGYNEGYNKIVSNPDNLDNRYYEINEKVMEGLESFYSKILK